MRALFIFLMLLPGSFLNASDRIPLSEKGVLDLRGVADPDHFVVKLNGEWEFYWKKMLRPHDFASDKIKPAYYGKVPSYWTDYARHIPTTRFGYATYRLMVLLPRNCSKQLAIDLPVFDSSYDIYINGKYLGGNGVPGSSPDDTKPEYKRNFFRIIPGSDTLSLIINVANYNHRRGGFWLPAKLGTFDIVQKRIAANWAAEWSVISLLAVFSVLFLIFFILLPREKTMGYLSLVSIGLALRPFFTAHYMINNFMTIPWEWMVKCEYIALFLTIISMAWLVSTMYPSKFARITTYVVSSIFAAGIITVLIFPVRIFSYLIIIYYPSLLIFMLYLLSGSIKGAIKGKTIDIIYTLSFVMLLAGGVHDIIVSLGRSNSSTGYLLTYLVVVFIFIQATMLLYKWISAFREKEKLQGEMEYMNRNLEQIISERTFELQKRNEEIGLQNSRIALQNKQLSETIQMKNKIFSVIAHDLRSPVVNILYMLNLLKEKEYKEKYDSFAASSIQYAQRVIGLLENMLVWGRGQEDKIKFSPENHDLADIILTNLSIFKETADNKEISVNFTQVGSSVAFCDRDLMDIIIRNLLSNAVKYTPRKGRISIFLKDKKNNGGGIMLKISDNGVGISDQKQSTLFTSDEIDSTPGTENEKGTGFGLRLCHELVKINNGTITVDSKIDEGTSFIISLPS